MAADLNCTGSVVRASLFCGKLTSLRLLFLMCVPMQASQAVKSCHHTLQHASRIRALCCSLQMRQYIADTG